MNRKLEIRVAKLERLLSNKLIKNEDYEDEDYYDDSCKADLKIVRDDFLEFTSRWSGMDDITFDRLVNDVQRSLVKLNNYILELEKEY